MSSTLSFTGTLRELGLSRNTIRRYVRAKVVPVPRPAAPARAAPARELVAESFTSAVPAESRQDYLVEVESALAAKLRDASGTWTADRVRLRFAATK